MLGNGFHEERRDTVSDLADTFGEFSGKIEIIGKRAEALEFLERKPPALGPVHGAVHAKISVIATDCTGRFLRIEFHGIEALASDYFLRTAEADPAPVPVGAVFL